jgi:hypothetical protein
LKGIPVSKNRQQTFDEPGPGGAFYSGELSAFARSLGAAFVFADPLSGCRPRLQQVVLGRLHNRPCLAATNGYALIVHWMDATECTQKPRDKRELATIASVGWHEWRLIGAILRSLDRRAAGRVIATKDAIVIHVDACTPTWAAQSFRIALSEKDTFPPVAKVLRPDGGNCTSLTDSYLSAPLLESAISSIRKHGSLFETRRERLAINARYGASKYSPVLLHSPYSLALVMPFRADVADFNYGRELWNTEA